MKITNDTSILISSARWGSSQRFCRLRYHLAVIFPFYTLVRSTEWYSLFISFAAEGSRQSVESPNAEGAVALVYVGL